MSNNLLTIEEIEEILHSFKILPKNIKEPTYLELCKYPKRRFEEICSRLLQFYFDPNKEHGLSDLLISSLMDKIKNKNQNFVYNNINIYSEKNAEGKKIDLLITSKDFALGIENKINAKLNNPLEIYKKTIEDFNENAFKVVLSLRKIINKDEIEKINKNNFINLTYADYFSQIKYKLGEYFNKSNFKYLTYLNDFIQTLENMEDYMSLNEKLSNYFFDNSKEIEELNELFKVYLNEIKEKQINRLNEIEEDIKSETKDKKWNVYNKEDGLCLFYKENYDIGIEAYYENTRENACGKFNIYLTSWNIKDWKKYEDKIKINNKIKYNKIEVEEEDNWTLPQAVNKVKQLYLNNIH